MITTNIPSSTSISAVRAKVDISNGSTLVSCTCSDYLQEFIVTREGDTSKFFGFGVAHKLTVSLIDTNRTLTVAPGNIVEIKIGDGTNFDSPYPTFYIAEVSRDEKTNTIKFTAYDALYKANTTNVSAVNTDLDLTTIINMCAVNMGLEEAYWNNDEAFNIRFTDGANLVGDEPLKVLLNAVAEVTQTIYYVNNENKLIFKRLDKDGDPLFVVDKEKYFELTT